MNPLQIQERLDVLSDRRLPLTERIGLVSTLVSTQRLNRYNVGKLGNRLGKLKELNRRSARNEILKAGTSGMLEHLADQIPHIHSFTGQAIGNALYGLFAFRNNASAKQIIEMLFGLATVPPTEENMQANDGEITALLQAFYHRKLPDCHPLCSNTGQLRTSFLRQ